MAPLDQGQSKKRSTTDDATPPSPGKVPRRKYKRHPKPDANAPERPLTAYVRFSKDKRKEYQAQRLSFSELAKQIGIDWQDLSPTTKNRYLTDTSTDWTNFRKALDDYHATPEYADYVQYLRDFAGDNPDSNVKLPQSDEPGSPSDMPSTSWDAEGSPISEEEPHSTMASDLPCATQVQPDLGTAQFQYDLAQDRMNQPMFLAQDAIAQQAALISIQDFDYQGNAAFQPYTQPHFADPWQQQQQQQQQHQQQQQPMHLMDIGPRSRYSRNNTSLTQALNRASDSRALELELSQDSSANATPDSDFFDGRGSSMSSVLTSASPAHMRGPMSANAMYTSAVMPNTFAHSLDHTSVQQAIGSKNPIQTQQQQRQYAHNQANMFKMSQASTPQADALNATINVNSHYYNQDVWMAGLLEQNFGISDFQDTY